MKSIYFSNWYDKDAPKQYWVDIENLSKKIAEHLQHNSTIFINQFKEKFGQCRVYVSLADFELVKNKSKIPEHKDSYEYVCNAQNRALPLDAAHYRKTYFYFKCEHPQYWKESIKGGADYPELLCENDKELEQALSHSNNLMWKKIIKKVYNDIK